MNQPNLFLDTFKKVVAASPDKAAIVDEEGERRTTYAELDVLSSRVAALLAQEGVGTGDVAPVVLNRGMEYVAAELGVLKAGAAFAGLSMEYPESRLHTIQQDCGSQLRLDEDFVARARNMEPAGRTVSPAPTDPAFVIYTSGSTGRPKGIVHTHRSLGASIGRYQHLHADARGDDVFLSLAPLSFVIMVHDLYLPLSLGLTVHIASEETRKDITRIQEYVAAHHPTISFISPQLLKLLDLEGSSYRKVLVGSERLGGLAGHSYKLVNGYGSSETSGLVLGFPVDRPWDNTPIGFPCEGVTATLVDENGKEVAGDGEGELLITSHLASGYLNLPEQTAQAFEFHDDGTATFHTGDICRRLPDGSYVYINRNDWMVKVNGQRVEIGEIERAIAAHPNVDQAVVKGFTNVNGQTYLCAYYTEKNPLCQDAMRNLLVQTLPDYMIPAHFVRLDRMPLNMNGKLDRKALTAPNVRTRPRDIVAARGPAEARIVLAFKEVLKMKQVSVLDAFDELGGDSLALMRLLTLLPGLTAGQVRGMRTPREIAKVWKPAGRASSGPSQEDVLDLWDKSGRMPIMDGMRYYKKTEDENNMPRLVVTLRDAVSPEALRHAAEKAFARYRVPRLRVVRDGGSLMLADNDARPVVHRDDGSRATVGGAENAGYLTRVAYDGHQIYVELFHGVTDGQGIMPFLHTLLYHYMERRYGLDDPANEGRVLAESEEDAREYAPEDLFVDATAENVAPSGAPAEAFRLPEPQMESPVQSARYELRVNAGDFESFLARMGTSAAAALTWAMNRAISDVHDTHEVPVVAALAIDGRSAVGAQKSMRCCVATVPVWLDDDLKAKSTQEQLTATGDMIWDGAAPERIRAAVRGSRRLGRHMAETCATLEAKQALARQLNDAAGSRFTYGISYVGEMDFGSGVNEHIQDVSAMICANTIPVIVEAVKFAGEYLIGYCTHLEDDPYVRRIREILSSFGVECSLERKPDFIETLVTSF